MTATAPSRSKFNVLDELILQALSDLRSARAAAAKTRNRKHVELSTRAEEHLNALLEYRHAVLSR
jgi:hypothetical protein